MSKIRLFFVCLTLGGSVLLEAQVPASSPLILSVSGQAPAPGSATTTATPHIALKFDDAAQAPSKEQLLLEVDRVDVSALAQFTDRTLQFDPATPLTAGSHEIRVSGTLPDGRAFQEIKWSFTVPEPKSRNWHFGLEPSATWDFGIQQEGPNPDRNKFSSNIALNGQGSGHVQTNLTSNFQGQDSPGPSGENFNLANLTAGFTASTGTSLSLWDVQANYDSLIVSNLARRGFTFEQKLPFLHSGFDAFVVRTETLIGVAQGFGLSEGGQRMSGFSYFFSPLKNPDHLTLRALYFTGENAKEEGFNFGGVTRGSKGNAYGFGLSTAVFSNQIRGEFFGAWSDFDFNASDNFSGNKDKAFLGRLTFSPTPATFHGRPSAFQAALEVQDLGTFFKSLANPFLVSDRRGFNVNSSWNWGILGFTGGVSRFHDNTDDIAILPSVDNMAYSGGFSIAPQGSNGPPRLPSVTFNAGRSEQQSIHAAVGFLAVHNIVDTYGSVITLARKAINLTLNLSYAINEDLNNRVPDTDSKNATLGAAFTPKPSYTFGPSVSFTRTANRNSGIDSDLWTYSLTTGFPMVPNVLTLDGQISYSSTETSDLLNRNSILSGTAKVSFLLGQFLKTRGRQAFSVRMSYNENVVEAPVPTFHRGLEIFGTLDVSWPF